MRVLIDARGLALRDVFIKVRDALGRCAGPEMIDVLTDSKAQAKKVLALMIICGCNVEMTETGKGWMLRMTGRSCPC